MRRKLPSFAHRFELCAPAKRRIISIYVFVVIYMCASGQLFRSFFAFRPPPQKKRGIFGPNDCLMGVHWSPVDFFWPFKSPKRRRYCAVAQRPKRGGGMSAQKGKAIRFHLVIISFLGLCNKNKLWRRMVYALPPYQFLCLNIAISSMTLAPGEGFCSHWSATNWKCIKGLGELLDFLCLPHLTRNDTKWPPPPLLNCPKVILLSPFPYPSIFSPLAIIPSLPFTLLPLSPPLFLHSFSLPRLSLSFFGFPLLWAKSV